MDDTHRVADGTLDDDVQAWVDRFDAEQLNLKALRQEIESELRTAITVVDTDDDAPTETQLFKVHDLRSRVKKRKSFLDKILRKNYSDPFNQMRDIVGARIVCLFLADLPAVDKIIREKFDVRDHQDKTKEAPPDQFRYRAVHYDCKIKPTYTGPHYDGIKEFWFEIQVRTILQDAWAVVEHILGYKGPNSIPDESRADFSALVGLFHLADKTFQQIRDTAAQQDVDAQAEVAEATGGKDITVSPPPAKIADLGLNRSVVKALLAQLYPDRLQTSDIHYSEFVEELAAVGVTSTRQLMPLLIGGHEDALRSEEENPPEEKGRPTLYNRIGFARESMNYALPEFRELRKRRKRVPPVRSE